MHRQLKPGHGMQGGYRDKVLLHRDGVRKAKDKLELNLARNARSTRASTGM